MLIPAYGVIIYSAVLHNLYPMLPPLYWYMLCAGTFIFSFLIPLTALLILYKNGKITDIYLKNNRQRFYPYLYTLLGYAFWLWFLAYTIEANKFLLIVAIGATVALAAVMIINRWWKISAHLTAMGGLLGAVVSSSVQTGTFPMMPAVYILIISLILMYARLYLNAHTPLQVVTGFLLGLVSTSFPILIFYV